MADLKKIEHAGYRLENDISGCGGEETFYLKSSNSHPQNLNPNPQPP